METAAERHARAGSREEPDGAQRPEVRRRGDEVRGAAAGVVRRQAAAARRHRARCSTCRGKSSGMGSTDVGDVSWVVPMTRVHDGVLGAGHAGALVAGGRLRRHDDRQEGDEPRGPHARRDRVRPVHRPEADRRREGRAHAKRLDGRKYAAMLEKDQPPPLDYRLPAKRSGPSE